MAATAIACFTARNEWPSRIFALPTMKFFELDFSSILALSPGALSAVTAYMLVMVFDIGGAMFGLGKLAGIVEGNVVPGSIAMFLAAATGTAFGALTGTTPLIIAAESAVGIKEGGRTGLVAVVVSMCFMVSLFLAPLIQVWIPDLCYWHSAYISSIQFFMHLILYNDYMQCILYSGVHTAPPIALLLSPHSLFLRLCHL